DDTNPITKEATKFLDAYKAKYPDKNVAAVSALGYDAYLLAYKAIEAAGSSDPVKVRDAIASIKDMEGVTGIINLTAEGDADKDTAVIKVVKDGKFVFQENMKVDK
ncbi:MAG: ABC transporter substrate-binding protein, partial [Hydrogenoanaerobacterium sp.]